MSLDKILCQLEDKLNKQKIQLRKPGTKNDRTQGKIDEQNFIKLAIKKKLLPIIDVPESGACPYDFTIKVNDKIYPINFKSIRYFDSVKQSLGSFFIPYFAFYPEADINADASNQTDMENIIIPALEELFLEEIEPDLSDEQEYIFLFYDYTNLKFQFLRFKQLFNYDFEKKENKIFHRGTKDVKKIDVKNSYDHFIEVLDEHVQDRFLEIHLDQSSYKNVILLKYIQAFYSSRQIKRQLIKEKQKRNDEMDNMINQY